MDSPCVINYCAGSRKFTILVISQSTAQPKLSRWY